MQSNLSIHMLTSHHEAFAAPEAFRLIEHFEWHYTPGYGVVPYLNSQSKRCPADISSGTPSDKQPLIE
jgi:hypothetical protein